MKEYEKLLGYYKYLQFSEIACDGESFWTVTNNYNAIYKISCKNFQVEYSVTIPEEDEIGVELYLSGIVKIGSKIYLIPGAARRIVIFNTDTLSFEYIFMEEMQTDIYPKFGVVSLIGKNLFCLPMDMQVSYILKIDTETDSVYKIPFVFDFEIPRERRDIFFFGCTVEETIWFGTGRKQIIGSFKTNSSEIKFIQIHTTKSYIYHIIEHLGVLYMVTFMNEVIAYEIATGVEHLIWKEDSDKELKYSRAVWFADYIWLFPFSSAYIVKIDVRKNEKVDQIKLPFDLKCWKRWGVYGRKYYGYYYKGEKIWMFPDNADRVLMINCSDNSMEQFYILSNREKELSEKFLKKELSRQHYEDNLLYLIKLFICEKEIEDEMAE